jgi:hypothetical protein
VLAVGDGQSLGNDLELFIMLENRRPAMVTPPQEDHPCQQRLPGIICAVIG